jgi:hypothetical protein
MIKTSVIRNAGIHGHSTLRLINASSFLATSPYRRAFTLGSPRSLNASKEARESRKGVVFYFHWHSLPCGSRRLEELPSSNSSTQLLTKPNSVSTVPTMIRGDWVLFHPVYTPEELKSVEVCYSSPEGLCVHNFAFFL